jgi:hypothetical protein
MVAVDPALVGLFWSESAETMGDAGCEGLENVPDLTPELWERYGPWAEEVATTLPGQPESANHSTPEGPKQGFAEALCRLRATPEARAMAAPRRMWPGRAGGQPQQPVRVEQILVVDGVRLRPLDPPSIKERLNVRHAGFFAPDVEASAILAALLSRAISESG